MTQHYFITKYYIYFLGGKLLSRMRVVPQDAAAPTAPPTIALPTKTAPLTIIGATFTSGEMSDENEIGETDGTDGTSDKTFDILYLYSYIVIIFFSLN